MDTGRKLASTQIIKCIHSWTVKERKQNPLFKECAQHPIFHIHFETMYTKFIPPSLTWQIHPRSIIYMWIKQWLGMCPTPNFSHPLWNHVHQIYSTFTDMADTPKVNNIYVNKAMVRKRGVSKSACLCSTSALHMCDLYFNLWQKTL